MATYQVNGPGGAVYQVNGPEGADPATVLRAINGNEAQQATQPGGGILRDIALAGRDVGEGVFDTLAIPHDLSVGLTNLISRGSNRFLGTHRAMLTTYAGSLSNALTQAGAPVPTSSGEKLAASIVKAGTGALTGAGVLGALGGASATTVPNLLRAGAAGATGGASADVARQAGAGPVGQFVAGLAGGLTPTALEGSLSAIGSIARPLTRSGQAQIAANTLVREAQNPTQAAANLGNAQPIVPGSMRTSGEASGDTGILALEKGIRARNPGQFGQRISEQNAARQAELADLGGTQADIAAAEQLRDQQTAPMRDSAFAAARHARALPPAPTPTTITTPVHQTIDRILASPAGARESIAKTMNWAKGLIGDHTDPETLYEVRKDLALAQQDRLQPAGRDAPNATMLAQARGQLGQVINSLDNAIESGAPGYKAYLARYAGLSDPINQMEAIQGLQQKASSGLDTSTGEPFLSAPQFARQLRATLDRANSPMPLRLTPSQVQRLQAVREDLQRGSALSSPTIRAPGSDTYSNFLTGRRFSLAPLGRLPLVKYLGVGHLSDWVDQRVNEALTEAMLNPQRAAALLRQGVPFAPLRARLTGALGRGALPATVGPIAALPASQQFPALPSPLAASRRIP